MSYVNAFAYIVYMVYLVVFLAILAGAVYFARGDVARGKKYIGGAIFVAIMIVTLPHALDYILGPSFTAPNAGNFDAYANFIYPYPDYAQQSGSDMTLTYLHPMKATVSMILIRLNFSTPSGSSAYWYLRLPPNPNPITISATDPIAVTLYYPNEIKNDTVGAQQSTVITANQMVVKYKMNVIDINDKNNANVTAVYTFVANSTSVRYTLIFSYKAPEQKSGGGIFDKIKNLASGLVSGLFHMIMDSIQSIGRVVLKYLPFLTGEETMIYFTLLPTDNMLGPTGNVIKDFYYKTSLPWGMVILLALAMLSGLDRLWNGDDDIAFKLTKDIVGTIIWMFGGYYFYMAFAGFINTIIIDIGIEYIIRMGYYINLLMGLLILYSGLTVVISDNASGTYIGMIMFIIGMFQAMAFMRFFLIAAAVALYPILAPWGLLPRYGVGGNGIVKGIVKQGVYGIIIAGLLRIVFTLIDQGGAFGAGAMMFPIAFIMAPQLIEQFVGAIASGEFSHSKAASLAGAVKGGVQKAGLAATGAIGGKIAAYRARKFETEVPENPSEKFAIVGDMEVPEEAGETYVGGGDYDEEGGSGESYEGGKRGGGGGGGAGSAITTVGGAAVAGSVINSNEKKKASTIPIGSAKVVTKDNQLADFMKVHAYHADKLPTGLHRAAYFRYQAKQLEEMAKPSWKRFLEGVKERNFRKMAGAGASMLASSVLRFNQIAASTMDSGIVAAAGLNKQNELIKEAYKKRSTYLAAAEAFKKLAEIEETKYVKQNSEEIKKLAEQYGGDEERVLEMLRNRALAQIPMFTEVQPKRYMSGIGKELVWMGSPLSERLFKRMKTTRLSEEHFEPVPGMGEEHQQVLSELKDKRIKIKVPVPRIRPTKLNIEPKIRGLKTELEFKHYQKKVNLDESKIRELYRNQVGTIKTNVLQKYMKADREQMMKAVNESLKRALIEKQIHEVNKEIMRNLKEENMKEVRKKMKLLERMAEKYGQNSR